MRYHCNSCHREFGIPLATYAVSSCLMSDEEQEATRIDVCPHCGSDIMLIPEEIKPVEETEPLYFDLDEFNDATKLGK